MAKSLHTITVDIDLDAAVTIDVQGKKGKSCLDITKGIEDALGASDVSRKPKPEMGEKDVKIHDTTKVGV